MADEREAWIEGSAGSMSEAERARLLEQRRDAPFDPLRREDEDAWDPLAVSSVERDTEFESADLSLEVDGHDAPESKYLLPLFRSPAEGGSMRTQDVQGGHDDRQLVTDTSRFPFSALCSLRFTKQNGRTGVGTGFLVSDNVIATAGHNICTHGGYVRRMEVYVGRRDRSSYLADEVVTSRSRLKVSRAWRTSRNSLLDWGVIVLRNRYGADFGRFTLKPWPASVLKSTKFNVVGYPQSSDTRTGIAYQMWAHVGRIIWVGMRTVRYRMDTSPGQSGAPIIAWEGSASSVVGVHNYGNPNFNQATRVTPEIKSAIQKVIASV